MTNFTITKNPTEFSHVKPGDTTFTEGGLRDFFLYRVWAWPKRPMAK